MSRIEDALKRIRDAESPVRGASATPPLRERKVVISGEKHHVSLDDLIRGGLLAPPDQTASIADQFRKIKRPLIANAMRAGTDVTSRQNVIMITSGLSGAGKTFCAVNLAVSVSLEPELNVLLVDADVAKPHISREFGLDQAPGLIDLLLNEKTDIAEVLVRTDVNDIQLLPAGRRHAHATELLASKRMSAVVKELATRYSDRIVLVDSPPLLVTSEAPALAGQVGQIVLVIEAGETSRQVLQQTVETLDPEKAVNILLNKVRHRDSSGQYGEYGRYAHERS